MSVRIIVDSTCDLLPALRRRVDIAHLTVHFGNTDYVDGVDLTPQGFYEKLAVCRDLPSTSQATPFAFGELFSQAVEAGDEVVCITCSSRLSGTFQSAQIAAGDFPGRVWVVDTLNIAISAAIMAEYALQLADAGRSAKEIADELYSLRDKVRLIAVVDTLEYLQRGGRVSKTVALAGGLLSIKPIIGIVDGRVEMIGKARGSRAANRLMNQEIQKLGVDLTKPMLLGYTGVDDSLLQKYMAECGDFWPAGMPATVVSGVVGAHAGPGAVAVAFFAK